MLPAVGKSATDTQAYAGGDRFDPLRGLLCQYAGKEMVDIQVPHFLWPILTPLEIGFTGALGRELGPDAYHRKSGWDDSYTWVIETVTEIYPVWYRIEEEFGLGAMLNLDDLEIAVAIKRPAGAEFIGVQRIANARKLRNVKGIDWYRKALDFRLADL